MKRVIIIQARMTSTRLPGKVLMDLAGRPMLSQQLRRLRQCRNADDIVVATTTNRDDDPVAGLAGDEGVGCFRGDEHDVLGRYAGAALQSGAGVVVRITADCPLVDPGVVDRVIDELMARRSSCDYASNVLRRTFPKGLDCEAFFMDALLRADRLATSVPAREHVTLTFYAERPDLFLLHSVEDDADNSEVRWTVDYAADLALVRCVFEGMDLTHRASSHREILAWMQGQPDVMRLHEEAVAVAAGR